MSLTYKEARAKSPRQEMELKALKQKRDELKCLLLMSDQLMVRYTLEMLLLYKLVSNAE